MKNDNDARGALTFRKKPVVIEASQWFQNGDHPMDDVRGIVTAEDGEQLTEGKVVRYYRHPEVSGDSACEQCGKPHHVHGWIDTLEQGHRVCPGDWIITGVKGERYPCKPDIFAQTYEPAAQLPAGDGLTACIKALWLDPAKCDDENHAISYNVALEDALDAIEGVLAAPRQPGEMGAGVDIKSWLHSINDDGYRTDNERMAARILLNAPGIVIPAASAQQDEPKYKVNRCEKCGGAKIKQSAICTGTCDCESAQQDYGGDETKWNCHCGMANCAGLHPNEASAQQDEREALLDAFDKYARTLTKFQHRMEPKHWPKSFPWFEAGYESGRAAQQVQADAGAVALTQEQRDALDRGMWTLEEKGFIKDAAIIRAILDLAARPAAESDKRDDPSHFDNADMMRARRDALEEAARLVENYEAPRSGATFVEVAASIRAIKRQDRAAMSREQSGGDE